MIALALVALTLAAVPAVLFLVNLRLYHVPAPSARIESVSILIPARNEEKSIVAAVESVLTSRGVAVEVIVLDDHSTDRTGEMVREIASRDSRVRQETAPALPESWCGKQHACHQLAGLARHELLLFLDADVRVEPEGIAAAVGFLESSGADLVSGVPRQETGSLLEKLVIPLIQFILLGFLPIARMRASTHPAYAAGCGQLFLTRRSAYQQSGGHAAIRGSRHDGITLPRAYRLAGLKTDLFDATRTAVCRMYHSASEVWAGFAKNATEGLGHPKTIVPFTLLLLGGAVLPFVMLVLASLQGLPGETVVAGSAVALALLPRLVGVARFRQALLGAILHPVGVLILLAIQWYALVRFLLGRPAAWKGRN